MSDLEPPAIGAGWVRALDAQCLATLNRVGVLLQAAHTLSRAGNSRSLEAVEDVFRAGVVLLYAALEDMVREAERSVLLKDRDGGRLDEIGFPPSADGGKFRDKIGLGMLLRSYPGSTVEEIADRAVNAWLDRKPYSNPADLAVALKKVGVDSQEVIADAGGALAALMLRRHQIAHRGDRARESPHGPPGRRLDSLDRQELVNWYRTANEFRERLTAALSKRYPAEDHAEARTDDAPPAPPLLSPTERGDGAPEPSGPDGTHSGNPA